MLLKDTRRLGSIFQRKKLNDINLNLLCETLFDIIGAEAYIISTKGKTIGLNKKGLLNLEIGDSINFNININLATIEESRINIHSSELEIFNGREAFYLSAIPVIIADERLGSMLLVRKDKTFTEEDIIIGEYGANIIGMYISLLDRLNNSNEDRKLNEINKSLNALSYSEKCAVVKIMEQVQSMEGLIIVSKVADDSRITRSAVVNALRKLESAGIIETRSLGMKGTMIKIINEKILEFKNNK